MGLGGISSSSSEQIDIMDSGIVSEPHSVAQRFRNKVFGHVRDHRDLLGYPRGCGKGPYMFVSTDLAGIFVEFFTLLKDNPSMKATVGNDDIIEIIELLVATYDEDKSANASLCARGCCGFWHSIPKESVVVMLDAVKSAIIASAK